MKIRVEEVGPVEWEGLAVTLYLTREPSAHERERIAKLIEAWYVVGSTGGFGGWLHFLSGVTFSVEDGAHTVEWWVDMGNVPREALDVLMRCFDGLVEEGLPLDSVALGWRTINGPSC